MGGKFIWVGKRQIVKGDKYADERKQILDNCHAEAEGIHQLELCLTFCILLLSHFKKNH